MDDAGHDRAARIIIMYTHLEAVRLVLMRFYGTTNTSSSSIGNVVDDDGKCMKVSLLIISA